MNGGQPTRRCAETSILPVLRGDILKSINGNRKGHILSAEQARFADQQTIEKYKIESAILMGWAGYAAFQFCLNKKFFKSIEKLYIFCGPGNNGGDGYVFAWHTLVSTDKNVCIIRTDFPKAPDAVYYAERVKNIGENKLFRDRLEIINAVDFIPGKKFSNKTSLFIDAVFGTGLSRSLDKPISDIAVLYNKAKVKKISLDIPTGISADGEILPGTHFRSLYTLAFSTLKTGHVTEPGISASGKIYVLPVGIVSELHENKRRLSQKRKIAKLRKPEGHKYLSGSVHILGGSKGFEGAALLAGKSFLATGGGICKIYSDSSAIVKILSNSPELMVHAYRPFRKVCDDFITSLETAKEPCCIIAGPGLASKIHDEFLKKIFMASLRAIIFDGGLLRQISAFENLIKERDDSAYLVLTPHRGEAEALLGKKITNMYQAAREIRDRYRATVFLKGPGGVLISENKNDDEVFFASQNFSLATAGTGDVLTGYLASALCKNGDKFILAESAITAYLDAAERIQNADKQFGADGLTASMLYQPSERKRGKS